MRSLPMVAEDACMEPLGLRTCFSRSWCFDELQPSDDAYDNLQQLLVTKNDTSSPKSLGVENLVRLLTVSAEAAHEKRTKTRCA